jgi:quercetin dioxygenase-like cupin family protein
MKGLLLAASRIVLVGVISLGVVVTIARAEPAKGVSPNVIGRATFDAFNLQADPRALEFSAQAKRPVDMIVRTHDYAPGSSTGWHSHPGPVFIQVIEG